MMQKRLWRREETLKFVQEYVKHRVLLVPGGKNESKNHKITRSSALSLLSMKMNMPGFGPKEAYRKLRNIKSTYGQELKKMRVATARGSKYVSNLTWFKTLNTALKKYYEGELYNIVSIPIYIFYTNTPYLPTLRHWAQIMKIAE